MQEPGSLAEGELIHLDGMKNSGILSGVKMLGEAAIALRALFQQQTPSVPNMIGSEALLSFSRHHISNSM